MSLSFPPYLSLCLSLSSPDESRRCPLSGAVWFVGGDAGMAWMAVYRQSANSGMEMEMMLLMEKMMKNPWLGRYPMGPTTRPSALGMSDSVIVWGFHLNCGIIWIVGDFHPYLIFVIFSPRALFLAKFFSTQKCVNRKIDLRQNSVNCQRKNVFHQNSVKCNRIL